MVRVMMIRQISLVAFRVLTGLMLAVSGFLKLIQPYQNFQYAIEQYALFPLPVEKILAQTVPWIEMFTGIFLILGLWTTPALAGAAVLFFCFVGIIGQALIRGLPIDDCGCFGESFPMPAHLTLVMDLLIFGLLIWCLRRRDLAKGWGLDDLFSQPG